MEGKKSPEEQEACWIQSMRRDRINTFKRVAAANFDAFCRKRDQDIQAGAARRMQTCQGRALSVHDLTQFARNGLLFRLEASHLSRGEFGDGTGLSMLPWQKARRTGSEISLRP